MLILYQIIPVIFMIIKYNVINIVTTPIIVTIILFLFFNNLKIGLRVIKKNPSNIAIKNLGNLYIFLQKLYIIFYINFYFFETTIL